MESNLLNLKSSTNHAGFLMRTSEEREQAERGSGIDAG